MRFRISRASDRHGDRCPFPGAEYVIGTKERHGHNREGEPIVTIVPDKRWEIDVNTFEELMNMAEEIGIILEKDRIIIYDDYVE